MKKQTFIFILFQILFFNSIFAQHERKSGEPLNFYLDCWRCDFDFVRQNLDFVSFVRDPNLADVHILSSSSRTGSGGRKYFLNFLGLNDFKDQNYEYIYTANQSETDDEIRNGLLKIIKTGVIQYIAQTEYLDEIEINLAHSENRKANQIVKDPWNNWVFRIEAGSDFQKEESQDEFSFGTEFSVRKVTENWKTELEADYDIDRENYFDDGEKIINRQNRTDIGAEYIKSLSPKWSTGFLGEYSSTTYLNIKNKYGITAGIEYNIFPWDVSNRKVFTLRYLAGVSQYDYYEETIYDKTQATLLHESLGLNLELVQPWGRIETRLEARHFFHDFSKNRISLDSEISVRLTKHLSVYSELRFEVVHDQFYLPKGNASLEDVLLRRRKLASTYEVWAQFGFSFTFGSIYSNVVNERM